MVYFICGRRRHSWWKCLMELVQFERSITVQSFCAAKTEEILVSCKVFSVAECLSCKRVNQAIFLSVKGAPNSCGSGSLRAVIQESVWVVSRLFFWETLSGWFYGFCNTRLALWWRLMACARIMKTPDWLTISTSFVNWSDIHRFTVETDNGLCLRLSLIWGFLSTIVEFLDSFYFNWLCLLLYPWLARLLNPLNLDCSFLDQERLSLWQLKFDFVVPSLVQYDSDRLNEQFQAIQNALLTALCIFGYQGVTYVFSAFCLSLLRFMGKASDLRQLLARGYSGTFLCEGAEQWTVKTWTYLFAVSFPYDLQHLCIVRAHPVNLCGLNLHRNWHRLNQRRTG